MKRQNGEFMFNMILVDDEPYEINKLTSLNVWNKYNINIKKSFTNPVSAMEFIEQNQVDIIISDISMPEMSGVEFLTQIRQKYKNIIFVFITAYTDFEYTHAAVVNNVFDYLLKPINVTDIDNLCSRMVNQLASISYNDEPNLQLLECQQGLIDFYSNKISPDELIKIFNTYKIPFDIQNGNMFIMQLSVESFEQLISNWGYNIDRLYYAIQNIMKNNYFYLIPLHFDYDKIIFLCILNNHMEFLDIHNMLSKQINLCENILKHNIQYSITSNITLFNNLTIEIINALHIKSASADSNTEPLINSAIDFIEKNYQSDISLQQIADYLSLSTYNTSRMFKKYTGESFINNLNQYRVNKAKNLLINTNTKISEIAVESGFCNKRTFYRVFKNYTGCSPSEYRNKFFS